MGVWGAGGFENDASHDWGRELLAPSNDFSEIEKALAHVQGYSLEKELPGDHALFALAACEVLLVLAGRVDFSESVPTEVVGWAQRRSAAPKHLYPLALRALGRIQTEPSQLFSGVNHEEFPEWKEAFRNLREQLTSLAT